MQAEGFNKEKRLIKELTITPLESIYSPDTDAAEYAAGYLKHVSELLQAIDLEAVARAIEYLDQTARRSGTIYFIGNGGSAAIASHFANDFHICASVKGHPPFRAVSLFDNPAITSCIANDYGYEQVFRKQLEPHLEKCDLLVALSVSGNSANILDAVGYARGLGVAVIGLTGFDGGRLGELADIHLNVPASKGEFGPVEDVFQILDHLMVSFFQFRRKGRL